MELFQDQSDRNERKQPIYWASKEFRYRRWLGMYKFVCRHVNSLASQMVVFSEPLGQRPESVRRRSQLLQPLEAERRRVRN